MNIKIFKAAVVGLVLSASSFASASLITINNVDILGITYDINFHSGAGTTYESLWGASGSINGAPTFFNNEAGAISAWHAISLALGGVNGPFIDTAIGFNRDLFWVPYSTAGNGRYIKAIGDLRSNHTEDVLYNTSGSTVLQNLQDISLHSSGATYASFTNASPEQVPEPSTLAIFALGMIGFVSRRFKKVLILQVYYQN